MHFFRFSIFILILIFTVQAFAQQPLPFLRVSPQAKVAQNVSFVTIEVDYSRPAVRNREIYGKLVPYGLGPNAFGNGKPMPWRAGANENTTISLSHDVLVNGNPLAAGTYSLHMIVNENEWTIILNKDHQGWGSFFYEETNDVLRFKVKPQTAPHREWLMYGFENLSANTADVFMHWEKMKVSFRIEIELNEVVLGTFREKLSNLAGFNPGAWATAARYCLQNDINHDEAMQMINKALSMNGGNTFLNNSVKAGLLTATGKTNEGDHLMQESIKTATEVELNTYGYQLMGQQRIEDAIKIFKLNIERHPESWNAYDSLGEALANFGEIEAAKKQYNKALEMAPAAQKARIQEIIKNL